MCKLDLMELKLCQLQAKMFEESVTKTTYSSPVFIRRFMLSKVAVSFDNKSYLIQSTTKDYCFEVLDETFGKSNYGKKSMD